MIISWDNAKRLANLDKHGLDFADLDVDFFLNSLIVPAQASFQGDRLARIASRDRCRFRAPRDGGDLRRLHALRWQKGKEPVR